MSDLIIVEITENEKTVFDGTLNKKEIKGNGKIIVKNPSAKSRLWNLICDLKETVNTTIKSREFNIGILNPNQDYNFEYEIENLKSPSLEINEIFDTNIESPEVINNAFLYNTDNKCKILISLSNPLQYPISNLHVVRDIHAFFKDIEIKAPNEGVAAIKELDGNKFLSWDIVTLEPGKKAELEIILTIKPSNLDLIPLGSLKVTYLVSNHKLSLLAPEVRGLTDSMSGIDRDEASQPGIWNCSVEFINESDFQVRLEDVKVTHKIVSGEETVVSQTPNRLLNPSQSWNHEFTLECKDVPELNSTIEFTPLFVVITRVLGEIIKEPTVYPVLSATIEKYIKPLEVDAYANTNMTFENVIVNNGSSPIERIKIIDTIPQDFLPPLINEIKIKLGDIDISSRKEYTEMVMIEPDNQNPDTYHKINIVLFKLAKDFLTNAKLILNYPIKARNPRPPPEMHYKTPISIEVNTTVPGKYYSKSPEQEPEIIVKYVKRKLKTLKSIKPGVTEGEFSISVRIENKGGVELENIIIKDKIPQNFELSQINVKEYYLNKIGEEHELNLKIAELQANEASIITYDCIGQGEYPRYEPEVIVQGRDASEVQAKASPSQGPNQVAGEVSLMNPEKKSKINDLFSAIFKKIDETVTCQALSDYIESLRDSFPPGPVLHQFMTFSKEMKVKTPEKLIVGSLRDGIVQKLKEFKEKYI